MTVGEMDTVQALGADQGGGFFGRFGKTPFSKQLGWRVSQSRHAEFMVITPLLAEEMLKRNAGPDYRNRMVSAGTFTKYVQAMRRGWKLTGEPIIFSKSGRLLNGQHRLKACVAAGAGFETLVVFGIEDDAFAWMDTGQKRTAGDIFSINGVADANKTASAVLWVWKYHNSGMNTPHAGLGPVPDQIYDYFINEHQAITASLHYGRLFDKHKLAPPSLMAAMHYLCAQKHREQANHFFHGCATGASLPARDHALKLRNKLVDAKIGGGRLADIFIAAFTIMCWNAKRRSQPAPMLKWRTEQAPDLPFPTVI